MQNGQANSDLDFVGTSWTVQFPAGSGDSTQPATFTVRDTTLPSPDRTYTVKMRVTAGDAIISQSKIASVTVAASNDPYGVFGFQTVSLINFYFIAIFNLSPSLCGHPDDMLKVSILPMPRQILKITKHRKDSSIDDDCMPSAFVWL